MPYVNIQVTREGVTKEQKERLIAGTTELLREVLAKPPELTFVVIEEVDTDNWGHNGRSVTAVRAEAAARK